MRLLGCRGCRHALMRYARRSLPLHPHSCDFTDLILNQLGSFFLLPSTHHSPHAAAAVCISAARGFYWTLFRSCRDRGEREMCTCLRPLSMCDLSRVVNALRRPMLSVRAPAQSSVDGRTSGISDHKPADCLHTLHVCYVAHRNKLSSMLSDANAYEKEARVLDAATGNALPHIRDPFRFPEEAAVQSETSKEVGNTIEAKGGSDIVFSADDGNADDEKGKAMLLDFFDDLLPHGESDGQTPAEPTSQGEESPKQKPERAAVPRTDVSGMATLSSLSVTTDGVSQLELDEFQLRAVDLALRGYNLFITGGAGTGKSRALHHVVAALRAREAEEFYSLQRETAAGSTSDGANEEVGSRRRRLSATANTAGSTHQSSNRHSEVHNSRTMPVSRVYVTATTGLAAVQLGGTTIHNFAGISYGATSPEALLRRVRRSRRSMHRWKRCRVLIIDEISMLDAALFKMLDYVARRLRRQASLPFGGIQLILCGDFHQLAPIAKVSFLHAMGQGSMAMLLPSPRQQQKQASFFAFPRTNLSNTTAVSPSAQPYVISDLDAFFATTAKDTSSPTPTPTPMSKKSNRYAKAAEKAAAQEQSAAEAFAHAVGCAYTFETVAWQRLQLWPVVLKTPHRQANDAFFRRVLDEVRRGELSREGYEALAARSVVDVFHRPDANGPMPPPTLAFASGRYPASHGSALVPSSAALSIRHCATNNAVDARNALFFAQLPPQHHYFKPPHTHTDGVTTVPAAAAAAPFYVYYAADSHMTEQQLTPKRCRDNVKCATHRGPVLVSAGHVDDSNLPAEIALKIGTRVLLVCNVAPRHFLVNGSIGEVVGFLHPLEMMALVAWTAQKKHHRMHRSYGKEKDGTAGKEEAVPLWVGELRRRGGFSVDNDDDILNCVETSQSACFSRLWWRMQRTPQPTTSSSSRSGDRRGPPKRRSGYANIQPDKIPYDLVFTSQHCIDLLRIAQPPSTRCEHRDSLRRRAFRDDVMMDTIPAPYPLPHAVADADEDEASSLSRLPWKRRLCDLRPEERLREQLPIVHFESVTSSPSDPNQGVGRYAMVSPFCNIVGDGNGDVAARDNETGGLSSNGVVSRTQLPLRHAWALTVHKAQGLTLHPVQVDMESIRTAGQAYAALSRAPSLEALYILNFNPSVIAAAPAVKRFYASLVGPGDDNDGTTPPKM